MGQQETAGRQQETGLRERLVDVGVELVTSEGASAVSLREIARRGFADLDAIVDKAIGDQTQAPPDRLRALGRALLDYVSANRGMYELMFRYDVLGERRLGLQEAALPAFRRTARLFAEAQPDATVAPEIIAGTMWATLHGIVQLWEWGSLRTATGLDDPEPLLRAALDAHLGPAAL